MASVEQETTITGRCHCGQFAYELRAAPVEQVNVAECSCSLCSTRGVLWMYVEYDASGFRWTRGSADALAKYVWNNRVIEFCFCGTCGCTLIWLGVEHPGGRCGVNVRCVDGVEIDKLNIVRSERTSGGLPPVVPSDLLEPGPSESRRLTGSVMKKI